MFQDPCKSSVQTFLSSHMWRFLAFRLFESDLPKNLNAGIVDYEI